MFPVVRNKMEWLCGPPEHDWQLEVVRAELMKREAEQPLDAIDIMLLQHPEMWGNDYPNAYKDIVTWGK